MVRIMMPSALSRMFGRRREQHCPPDDDAAPYYSAAAESPSLVQPPRGPPRAAVTILVNAPKEISPYAHEENKTALLPTESERDTKKMVNNTKGPLLPTKKDQAVTKRKRPKIVALLPILMVVLASIAVLVSLRITRQRGEIKKRSTQALTLATDGTSYDATGQTVIAYVPASSIGHFLESLTSSGSNQVAVSMSSISSSETSDYLLITADQMVIETDASSGVVFYRNLYIVDSLTGSTSPFLDIACDPTEAYCHILASDDDGSSTNNYLRALLPKPHPKKKSSSGSSSGGGFFFVYVGDYLCDGEVQFTDCYSLNFLPEFILCLGVPDFCSSGLGYAVIENNEEVCGCFRDDIGVLPCFSHDSIVTSVNEDGMPIEKLMYEVSVGDYVLTGSGRFQKVYGFMDRHEHRQTEFLQFFTVVIDTNQEENQEEKELKQKLEAPPPLEVTGNHLVSAIGYDIPIPASQLKVGDRLLGTTPRHGAAAEKMVREIVQIKSIIRDDGIYSPLTADGTIAVNGMVMSTYASPETAPANERFDGYLKIAGYPIVSYHNLLHLWFTPMRLVCLGISDSFCMYHDPETGMSPWTEFGERINRSLGEGRTHWIVELSTLVVIVAILGPLFLIEQGVATTMLLLGAHGEASWLVSGMTCAGGGVAAAALWHMKQPMRA